MHPTNDFDKQNAMNGQIHKQLPHLLAMAHDRSDEGRMALADKLTEIFLSQSAALTLHEERLVYELIEDLLQNESASFREALISGFAKAVDAPRSVALRVVNGPALIAYSVLTSNENLSDDDLISIVEKKGVDHAAAIATRKQINESVADALVTTGDLRVMQIVAENMGAKLSPKALDIMVDAARLAAMLQKPILNRPELTAECASRLYWWVAQDLRKATLERFGLGPGRLESALKKAIEENLAAHDLKKDDNEEVRKLADWLEERKALNTALLPQLLRAGYYRLFNIAVSRLAKISPDMVETLTSAADGRLLVVLCQAIGVNKGNFVSIFLMSRGGRPDEQVIRPRELSSALAAFDRLDARTAQAMLQTWKANPDALASKVREIGSQREVD